MASVKVLLYKSKQKSDGRYPIALRVIKDRKVRYHYIEWIDEKHWDVKNGKVKTSYPNSGRLNNLILKKLTEASDLVLEAEAVKKDYSSAQITRIVKQESTGSTFFRFAEEFLNDLKKEHKYGREIADRGKIKMFQDFLEGRDISFQEVDETLLRKLKVYMIGQKGVKERTVMNTYVVIRTIFNRAIAAGIVDQKYYPFGKNKIRIKFPDTLKIGLNEQELTSIEELDLEEWSGQWHARNVFLFSFYLAGIRVSDTLRMKWGDIRDGRIFYQMGKNQKIDSLKLPTKVRAILEYYKPEKENDEDYIFPELKKADPNSLKDQFVKMRTADKKFNYYLGQIAEIAKIDKEVTMHIARHSFGNIAGDRISPQMLQKLYRHTSLTTTIGYQKNFIFKDADEALDTVIGF